VPKDSDPFEFPTEFAQEDHDESTAIVSLQSLGKMPRHQPKDRHLLVRMNGAARGQVTLLDVNPYRIGRAPDCELFLGDDGISRKHALLIPIGASFVLQDTDSANGTFVAGQAIQRHVLRDGDTIQFGPSALFRYTLTDAGQEALLRQLFEASVTDALTGTRNREYFDTQLRSELSFARRHKTDVSLVLFDVDHFKRVNDGYGHPAGDEVLIQIAKTVSRIVRNEDVLARYGGEEFVLILRDVGIIGAQRLGERLRETVEQLTVPTDAGPVRVTVSVGCASMGLDYDIKPELLLATADRRLYAAKHAGRNRVVANG
jgi:two-component system, cell cycle response regulator